MNRRPKFEKGTQVRIISKASKHKGWSGTVVGYCKGRYPNIARVQILDKVINLFDTSLEEDKILF